MIFRVNPTNRPTRLLASLLLAAVGGGLLSPWPPFGLLMLAAGCGLALYQGIGMWRDRRDPYDLEGLRQLHEKDLAQDEPEDEPYERDMAYCHRCNLSVPATHTICPECGGFLGA